MTTSLKKSILTKNERIKNEFFKLKSDLSNGPNVLMQSPESNVKRQRSRKP